jgi:ech hydrogenase subunit D
MAGAAVSGIAHTETIAVAGLLAHTQAMADRNLRFITMTCLDAGEQFEIFYHFDDKTAMRHLRLPVGKEEEVPSISGIYLAAFLVENEIKELFGAKITGIAIDYHNRLFLTDDSEPAPMAKAQN